MAITGVGLCEGQPNNLVLGTTHREFLYVIIFAMNIITGFLAEW